MAGLVFWVPFLARMIAVFAACTVRHAFDNCSLASAQHGLNQAISFYVRGFMAANNILHVNRFDSYASFASGPVRDSIRSGDIGILIREFAYTALFYILVVGTTVFFLPL